VSLTPGFDQGMLAFDTHYLTPVIEQEDTDPFYTLRLSHSWYRTGDTEKFPLDIHCLSHGSVVEFIYIKY